MATVTARSYLSPTLVLLAMDWDEGEKRQDFLGFAIERIPGFRDLKTGIDAPASWLPNRISFTGPPPKGQPDPPSKDAPVQKFMWWDARLEGRKPGETLTYEITPVCGKPGALELIAAAATKLAVTLPPHEELGIGTWFNRAVMSSQAFSRKLAALGLKGKQVPTPQQALDLREWLANGMNSPVPTFVKGTGAKNRSVAGAIYHLTDELWIIPALEKVMAQKAIGLVYDAKITKKDGKPQPNPNDGARSRLAQVSFFPRNKTNIMHNKFLVTGEKLLDKTGGTPLRLTCGSANYTTEGLTSQANLVHTFDSSGLARLYFERFQLIKDNPAKKDTAAAAGWSPTISVGDAGVRVFFSPEPSQPNGHGDSIETIVQAIHGAQSSVIFCLFTPTDKLLRDACFSVGDGGKMMFGLVNVVASTEPTVTPTSTGKVPADRLAALEIYHRSKDKKDVIGAKYFNAKATPKGFETEINIFPGDKPPPYPPVIVHHKFIVIDAETDSPTIYSGSANMSGNSVFENDENLLEIKGSPRLARLYLAEFLRLYEHYRARAGYIAYREKHQTAKQGGFVLRPDRSWATKHFQVGTAEYKARKRLLGVL